MTTTLITGGNKGLGLESAKRLRAAGHDVWIGARDTARGEAAAQEAGVHFVQLDVTDDASVAAAAKTLQEAGGLDVLVNNAGIATADSRDPRELTADAVKALYDVNVFGIVRVTQAFLPLLEASGAPVVVNVSSGLGSHAATSDPDRIESSFATIAYGSSKAAVAMLTSQYAKAFPNLKVNVVDPGYTATDLNGNSGHQSLTEGTDAIVAMASIGDDFAAAPTGTFTDRSGTVAW